MLKFLFGLALICGGFYKTLFSDPVWGIYLFAVLTHIRLGQLSENFQLQLNIPIIIACLTFILYLTNSRYGKKFGYWPLESILMGLMVAGMAASSAGAEFAPAAAWAFTWTYCKYWIFFILFINMVDSLPKIEMFHRTMILSAAWLVYRCWDLRGTTGARFENVGGDVISDANHYAAALVLLFPFVFQKTLSRKKWEAIAAAVLCFGMIMAIFITGSRGGMLGLGALFVLLFVNFKEQRKKILITIFVITLMAAPFVNEYHYERFESLLNATTSQDDRDASAQGRVKAWKLALQIFNEHKLLGVGPENFQYYSGVSIEGKPLGEKGHVTHSIWMESLSGGGLAVTIPFLLLLYLFFRGTKKTISRLRSQEQLDAIYYILTIRISLAAFLVCATFLNRLIYEPIYWCIGLAAVHRNLTISTKKNKLSSK